MFNSEISTKNELSTRGELILAAAQKLFLKQGYDQTSLEMIINEAGGSRRSIYNEFGNKQGLLLAVMRKQVDIQIDIIASINYDLSPDHALKEMATRFLKRLLSDTLISLYRLVIQVVPKVPEAGLLIYDRGPLSGVTPLTDYLRYLNTKGYLAIEDCSYAAFMLIAMIKDNLHFKAVLVPSITITDHEIIEHIDRSVNLFIKAYQPN